MWFVAAAQAQVPWMVRPELNTEVPLQAGVAVSAEGPARVRARVGAGKLPGPYVGLINGVATTLWPEDYTEDMAGLVETTLQDALVLHAAVGWRVHPSTGWMVHAGYTWIGLGGSATGAELLQGFTGTTLPAGFGGDIAFDATSRLRMARVELGWERTLWRSLDLRLGLGWGFTLSSQSTIEPASEPRPWAESSVDALCDWGEEELDQEVFPVYVHPPVLSVALGWRFGSL